MKMKFIICICFLVTMAVNGDIDTDTLYFSQSIIEDINMKNDVIDQYFKETDRKLTVDDSQTINKYEDNIPGDLDKTLLGDQTTKILIRQKRAPTPAPPPPPTPSNDEVLQTVLSVQFWRNFRMLSPFRNSVDLYQTLHALIFHRPGFVICFLNTLAIFVGPYYAMYGGGGGFTTRREVGRQEIEALLQSGRSQTRKTLHVPEEFISNIVTMVTNNTDTLDTVEGLFDAFDSFSVTGLMPLSNVGVKSERRIKSAKTVRKVLKGLSDVRRPGLFIDANSTSMFNSYDQNATNIFTGVIDEDDIKDGRQRYIGNANSFLVDGFPDLIDDDRVDTIEAVQEPDENNVLPNTEADGDGNLMEQISDVSGLGTSDPEEMIEHFRKVLPQLLRLLAQQGFYPGDLMQIININDIEEYTSIEGIRDDLMANEKFVNALAAVLDVQPDELTNMSVAELINNLKQILTE